jgi:hypothetical protein
MKTRLNCKKLSFCLLLGIAISVGSYAQTPNKKISFQGFLKDNTGKAVSNGNYSMVFSLYDVATGGTALWSETNSVSVTDGVYAVQLGGINSLTSLLWDKPYYMGINIGGNELSPRTELTYSPYAFSVERALTVACSGDIGDIKYSILNPTQFKAQNGACWVPMDGKPITGSKLANILGPTFVVPDASGLFFRAAEYTSNTFNDPDRGFGSPIAEFQAESLKGHSHKGTVKPNDPANYIAQYNGNNYWSTAIYNPGTGNLRRVYDVWFDINTSIQTDNTGGTETRPNNINLYTYIRIN